MAVSNVTPPTISGTARVGATLSSTNGTWTHDDPLQFTYQWERCDAAGANCVDIAGATGSVYVIQNADIGSTIRLEVTATEYTPTPTTGQLGVSYLRYGNGELPTSHISDYDNVIVSYGGAPALGASAATRGLVYMSSITCKTHAGGAYYYGVSKEEVEANNWVLKTSGGQSMYNVQYGGTASPLGDIGNSAYQLRWGQNVVGLLNGWGADGVFVDDCLRTLDGISGGKTAAAYPTMLSVQAAYASFSAFITDYLHNHGGYYVMLNASGYVDGLADSDTGKSDLDFWSVLTADALVAENWQYRSGSNSIRKQGPGYLNEWDGWQRLPAYCESSGKAFTAIVSSTTQAYADYNTCSMLLDTNHGSVIWCPGGYDSFNRSIVWHALDDTLLTLGDPVSAKVHVGNRWEREYDGGTVWVDPVAGTSGIDP